MLEQRGRRVLAVPGVALSRPLTVPCTGLALALMLAATPAGAHQDSAAQVRHLQQALELDSVDTSALLRRADLHRRQQQWPASQGDYETILSIDPDSTAALLGLAQLALDQQNFQRALDLTQGLTVTAADYPAAWLARARALSGLQRTDAAAYAWNIALRNFTRPLPEHYLEYARTLTANPTAAATRRAITVLDEGNDRLDNPISLHSHALGLEIARGDLDAALLRIDRVLKRNGQLPNWQLQQAEILLQLARKGEARESLQDLVLQIEQLPPHRQYSQAMVDISRSSHSYLYELAGQ